MQRIINKKDLEQSAVFKPDQDSTIKIDDVSILEFIIYDGIKDTNSEEDTKEDP